MLGVEFEELPLKFYLAVLFYAIISEMLSIGLLNNIRKSISTV